MTISTEETFDFLFKIVLIGDCGTGKTCVVQRFKNGTFIERHGNTIGVDFSMKTVIVDGKKVKAMCQYLPEVLFFLESSAKTNSNIEEAFMYLATELKVRQLYQMKHSYNKSGQHPTMK
nr:unnamed protein product [Callosobruchus analis]